MKCSCKEFKLFNSIKLLKIFFLKIKIKRFRKCASYTYKSNLSFFCPQFYFLTPFLKLQKNILILYYKQQKYQNIYEALKNRKKKNKYDLKELYFYSITKH